MCMSRRYHNAEWLQEQYWEKGKTTGDIADECGVDRSTIVRAMQRNDVETRDMSDYDPKELTKAANKARRKPPSLDTNTNGYERIRHQGNEVKAHRLLAVAEHGVPAVEGKHVHHKNGIPWDNRPENLEVVDGGEHLAEHYKDREIDDRGRFV